jgi:hypothetical protein
MLRQTLFLFLELLPFGTLDNPLLPDDMYY